MLHSGTSLVVQWLRLHAPHAGGTGSIPAQGPRSHMPQLKSPHAATQDASCHDEDTAHSNGDPTRR